MNGEPDDALLVRYLMGGVSEQEKVRIEEAFFADEELFARMQHVEEDLIERHLRGELQGDERKAFEAAYAAPPRRERVLFAQALQRELSGREREDAARSAVVPLTPRTRRTWIRFGQSSGFGLALAAAAAVVLAVVGVLPFAWQANGLRSSLASIEADNETLRQQRDADRRRIAELEGRTAALADELGRARGAGPAAGEASRPRTLVATFVLAPGLLRGTRAPARVVIGADVAEARLQLTLDPGVEGDRFRAELHDASDRIVFRQEGLGAAATDGGRTVLVTVPATVARAGEYEVVLSAASGRSGLEEVARYYFEVVTN
jgi:hypothetical protein